MFDFCFNCEKKRKLFEFEGVFICNSCFNEELEARSVLINIDAKIKRDEQRKYAHNRLNNVVVGGMVVHLSKVLREIERNEPAAFNYLLSDRNTEEFKKWKRVSDDELLAYCSENSKKV